MREAVRHGVAENGYGRRVNMRCSGVRRAQHMVAVPVSYVMALRDKKDGVEMKVEDRESAAPADGVRATAKDYVRATDWCGARTRG